MATLKVKRERTRRLICVAFALAVAISSAQPLQQSSRARPDLYAQAVSVLLDRNFPSSDTNYLLLDMRTREVIAMRWPHADAAIPAGSLLKPFVAMAYGELHPAPRNAGAAQQDTFPTILCRGKGDGCWRSSGHGSLQLEKALAVSCNAYFLALAREVAAGGPDAIDRVSATYGLPAPPSSATLLSSSEDAIEIAASRSLIGVTAQWRVRPLALARAYAALVADSRNEVAARLIAGMRMAALHGGTASRVGTHAGGVLAKTGTAPCVADSDRPEDRCLVNGDGLVVVMTPADAPQVLLLVRRRGTTGALTAELAGEMLTRMEDVHVPVR